MPNLTSQLAVKLIDGVSGPARGAARSIREIGRSAKSVDGATVATNRLGNAAHAVVARAASYGTGLFAVGAIAQGAKAAVLNYAELERKMLRVGITADASNKDIAAATDELRRMSQIPGMPAMDKLVEGVDTLVTQGKNLPESLAMIRAIAQTAAASGAEVSDISATAGSVSSAMGIVAGRMQSAFDIMVAGGKAGKFELKDMARYLPSLAPAAAAVGLKGEEGLRSLVAYLQVVRNMTGNTEEAASSMNNIFAKMESDETTKRFSKMGIDLRKAMADARKEGKPLLDVFVQLADQAVKGDLSKLPQLFQDMELARGMRALMSQKGAVDQLRKALGQVDGSTLVDFQRIAGDTTAKIEQMTSAWDGFLNTLGKRIAPIVTPVLNELTNSLNLPGSELPTLDPNRRGALPGGGPGGSTIPSERGREAQNAGAVNPMAGLAAGRADEIARQNAETWLDRNLPNRVGTAQHDAAEIVGNQRLKALATGTFTPNQSIQRETSLEGQIRAAAINMAQQMARAQSDAQKQAINDAFSGSLTKMVSEMYSLQTGRMGQPMVPDTTVLATVKHVKDIAVNGFSEAGGEAMTGFGAGITAQGAAVEAAAQGVMNRVKAIVEQPLKPNIVMPEMTVPLHGRGGSPAILPAVPGKQSNASGARGGAVSFSPSYAFHVNGQQDPEKFADAVHARTVADARKALRGVQSDVGSEFG